MSSEPASKSESPGFRDVPLRIVAPDFGSPLTDLIIDLDHLRRKIPGGSTPAPIFSQIKDVFHMLESIASARIEGNRTTVAEYVETKIEGSGDDREGIREIKNMEAALRFIDENIEAGMMNRAFICELHKMVVEGLTTEGSRRPGDYRASEVKIQGSGHVVVPHQYVARYMDELFGFINHADEPKYDLLKTALAHHRFVWIHPFDNGNGRTVRLFTYAMLVKLGFNVNVGRIINPAAVFCHDRKRYGDSLARADRGDDQGLLEWSAYVLEGLHREIKKIDRLMDYAYLKGSILIPAIDFSLERKTITEAEAKILKQAVEKKEVMNADIKPLFPSKNISDISRMIAKLKEKKMLLPAENKQRKYHIALRGSYLMRGIIAALGQNDFLPVND